MRELRRVLAILALVAQTAAASPKEAADAFERGRLLAKQGNLPEACAAFAESLRHEFQYGALFNLATCEERRGNLASALAAFTRISTEDANQERATRSREYVETLLTRVARVKVVLSGAMAGTTVDIDGTALDPTGSPVPIDPGPHRITARTPAGAEQVKEITIVTEREIVEVLLTFAPPTVPAPHEVDPLLEPASIPTIPRTDIVARPGHRAAKITLGSGAVTLAAGLAVGGLAWSGWNSAEDLAMTDPVAANEDLDRVRLLGNTSTALVIVGAAAISVGIYLWSR